MTVSSLWKVLDSAGCGQSIGVNDIVQGSRNNNNRDSNCNITKRPMTLAIDLSIWICESMTTYGIHEQHANPTLHLVFTRTMKLLNLGVRLIFVIEGKQRQLAHSTELITNTNDNSNSKDTAKFRKRRSGTIFYKACNDCQQMLELLGVPVVRAKSEGEALCALLSKKDIVDGVISNDGDCLLFGAKVIYTKYSNENLDNGRVMRYDANSLYAITDINEETLENVGLSSHVRVQFNRYDLIAFAVLTGSDLSGGGFDKVGYKKAVRFIHKCHIDNPLSIETSTYDEMKSWAKSATANVPFGFVTNSDNSGKCCTRCNHPGSKRSHMKDGCVQCGTSPYEACNHVTSEDKLRLSLREKALAMKFNAKKVFTTFLRPNENQLPLQLLTHGVKMEAPNLHALLTMNLIVKGHAFPGSRAFVRQSVLRLMSRYELQRATNECTLDTNEPSLLPLSNDQERPVAKAINKSLVFQHIPSYEIAWIVRASVTDENGNGIDGYEFVTIESQTLIEEKYPDLVASFQRNEVIRNKQGDGMQSWRRNFLQQALCFGQHPQIVDDVEQIENNNQNENVESGNINVITTEVHPRPPKRHGKIHKKRDAFFSNRHFVPVTVGHKKSHSRKKKIKKNDRRLSNLDGSSNGDDVRNLLRFVDSSKQQVTHRQASPITVVRQCHLPNISHRNKLHEMIVPKQSDPCKTKTIRQFDDVNIDSNKNFNHTHHDNEVDINNDDKSISSSTNAESIYCNMGGYDVAMTPILSNQGIYPPIHIYIRQQQQCHIHKRKHQQLVEEYEDL